MPEQNWLDRPRNVRLLRRAFFVVLALTILSESLVRLHPHFAIEALFGFHAWFGLLSCGVMVLVAQALGAVLKRRATYYSEPEADR